ncbi:hypothetical protein BD311DRAFT_765065 [Dichomitus squalens]|uniref:DUF6534 domain-containing protein n=1 Tax=Dichomitus squalens TaxID=114155 RepID=A0A4Q9MDC0_9APHY|nr:hypothetical protein BD311DRAFT_765065 [Dichomitus squalens]
MGLDPSISLRVVVISTFISLISYGLSADQTYRYFSSYPKDARSLKAVIATLFLFTTLHVILVMQICYTGILSSTEGHLNSINAILDQRAFWLLPLALTAVSVTSHSFFARRVYMILGRSLPFLLVAGSLLFVASGLSLAAALYTFMTRQLGFDPTVILSITQLIILITLNLFVNAKLVAHLRNARTGLSHTDSIVDRLITCSVQTGAISSILGLVSIIMLATAPNLFYMPLVQLLAGFEANSVLAAVNSRRSSGNVSVQILDFDTARVTQRSTIVWARQSADQMRTNIGLELQSTAHSNDRGAENEQSPQKPAALL